MDTIEEPKIQTPVATTTTGPRLPLARGPLSQAVLTARALPPLPGDALLDGDFQLALYVCYELHYRGFEGVGDDAEWDPAVLNLRAGLEGAFEDALREVAGSGASDPPRGRAAGTP